MASDREKEIIQIAQSINDLSSIFNELSVLVIEQGTILDRIDYNVESTLTYVAHVHAHMHKYTCVDFIHHIHTHTIHICPTTGTSRRASRS